MDEIQKAIEALRLEGRLEITGRPKRVAEFFGGLEVATSAMQELQQYRQIGTVEECQGYKKHSKAISRLNNCNDCGRSIRCQIAPRPGEYCRINCAWWRAQGWKPMPEDNSAYWQQEAQRQAAAAGELKIALAERLSEINWRIKGAMEARQSVGDVPQRLICDWQIDRLNAEKVWLEGLINGEEDRHGIR